MKNLIPLAAVLLLSACASSLHKTAPIAPPLLPALSFKMPCLGYALHALQAVPANATPDERAKIEDESYAYSFEDAQGEQEYVECLEKEPGSDDYRKYHANAVRYFEDAKSRRDRYAEALPEGRRIASVKTTYQDVDEKRSKAVTEVVRQDGTRSTREFVFDKHPR